MIEVLDSTLREGEQTPGVYFDAHIKLAVARALDKVGVQYIEAGHPAVSPDIRDAVRQLAAADLKAIVGAHSRSLTKDVDAALECGARFLGIFYCVSEERLNGVFRTNLPAAIAQITQVISYAKQRDPELIIRYTPEDTVRSQFGNVVEAAAAAVESGADIISVADTTGYMVPGTDHNMYDYVRRLKAALEDRGLRPKIAVHCHNDRGLALANALDAYRAGADIIDAAAVGLGERAGIVDLAQLLVVLHADFGEDRWSLKELTNLYTLVSDHAGIPVPVNFPVTGHNAFTHCAGVHTHAATINPTHYESLNPDLLGRSRKFALDHMSGIASVRYALRQIDEPEDLAPAVLDAVKAVGRKGKVVELPELRHIVDAAKHNGACRQREK
ncbi:MAG: 2-isopropylmalate synthase [Gemmatimonadota bacterium]|nr:MAG: 2-isopropylmalate synthase [Gemmatimonadota bacterium]